MVEILTHAGCFIGIILLGWALRRVGFFKESDFHVLSKIVIKITLTAAIVTNFSGREMQTSMLLLTLMGFGFGVLMMIVGSVMYLPQGRPCPLPRASLARWALSPSACLTAATA